jgi:hypothetical protein
LTTYQDDASGVIRAPEGMPMAVVAALTTTLGEVWREYVEAGPPGDADAFFGYLGVALFTFDAAESRKRKE